MAKETFIQNLILLLGGIFATALAGILVYHYTKKSDCFTVLKKTTYESKKDIDLIKRFLVAQSRIIDTQTRKSHPKECLELENLAKEMFGEK